VRHPALLLYFFLWVYFALLPSWRGSGFRYQRRCLHTRKFGQLRFSPTTALSRTWLVLSSISSYSHHGDLRPMDIPRKTFSCSLSLRYDSRMGLHALA